MKKLFSILLLLFSHMSYGQKNLWGETPEAIREASLGVGDRFIAQETPDENTLALFFEIQPGHEVAFYFKSYKLVAMCFVINTNKINPKLPSGTRDKNMESTWIDYNNNIKTRKEYKNEFVTDYLTPLLKPFSPNSP